jgi:hypothetical protein
LTYSSTSPGRTFPRRAMWMARNQAPERQISASTAAGIRPARRQTSHAPTSRAFPSALQTSSDGGAMISPASSFERYPELIPAARAMKWRGRSTAWRFVRSHGPKSMDTRRLLFPRPLMPRTLGTVSERGCNSTLGNPLQGCTRQALAVLFAVAACPRKGATYRGLRWLLGGLTDSGVRQAVRAAARQGLVRVIHTPDGRGGRAVIRLTDTARETLRSVGLLAWEEG